MPEPPGQCASRPLHQSQCLPLSRQYELSNGSCNGSARSCLPSPPQSSAPLPRFAQRRGSRCKVWPEEHKARRVAEYSKCQSICLVSPVLAAVECQSFSTTQAQFTRTANSAKLKVSLLLGLLLVLYVGRAGWTSGWHRSVAPNPWQSRWYWPWHETIPQFHLVAMSYHAPPQRHKRGVLIQQLHYFQQLEQ
jgi:hypothetical protein